MTARNVAPLTNSVNSTNPVASTATKRWVCGPSAPFSGDRQRQNEDQRAAQSTPSDRELVCSTDRLGQFEVFERRYQPEQHQNAGGEGGTDQHRQ